MKYVCYTCGKEYDNPQAFRGHCAKHGKQRKRIKCPICKKEIITNGFKAHYNAHLNGSKKVGGYNRVYEKRYDEKGNLLVWNKGLTKETSSIVKRGSETLKEGFVSGRIKPSFKGKKHTTETKQKISVALSKNNHGGRCEWFEVSGVKVQGTWERNFAEHMNNLGIMWEKLKLNFHVLPYTMNGMIRHYTPDFLVEEKIYVELKGYYWGNDKEKMRLVLEQNEVDVKIIEKEWYEKLLVTKTKVEFINLLEI